MKSYIKNMVMNLIYTIILFSFIFACHAKTDSVKESLNNKTKTRKIDTTRIVNKVLDSTYISLLYGFDKDGKFAIYRNDFIKKSNVRVKSNRYYLSDDCDSLEHSINARIGKCWFLEFIQIDSITKEIFRLHYAIPYKSRGGYYDFNINDYAIVDSCKVSFKPEADTIRYLIFKD